MDECGEQSGSTGSSDRRRPHTLTQTMPHHVSHTTTIPPHTCIATYSHKSSSVPLSRFLATILQQAALVHQFHTHITYRHITWCRMLNTTIVDDTKLPNFRPRRLHPPRVNTRKHIDTKSRRHTKTHFDTSPTTTKRPPNAASSSTSHTTYPHVDTAHLTPIVRRQRPHNLYRVGSHLRSKPRHSSHRLQRCEHLLQKHYHAEEPAVPETCR